MRNKMEQLKKIQESAPLEKYEKIRSELKSDEHLVEASKEIEIAISMVRICNRFLMYMIAPDSENQLNILYAKRAISMRAGQTCIFRTRYRKVASSSTPRLVTHIG